MCMKTDVSRYTSSSVKTKRFFLTVPWLYHGHAGGSCSARFPPLARQHYGTCALTRQRLGCKHAAWSWALWHRPRPRASGARDRCGSHWEPSPSPHLTQTATPSPVAAAINPPGVHRSFEKIDRDVFAKYSGYHAQNQGSPQREQAIPEKKRKLDDNAEFGSGAGSS